jgi:hypothetical protein
MAVDLNLLCNFEMTIRGITFSGMQGLGDGAAVTAPFAVSVDGDSHAVPFTLATAAALTVWDDDDDKPSDFDFLFFVADQDMFIQVICSATSFTVPVAAGVPFILAPKTDGLTAKALGAASTTPMSGSAPSVTEIDSIVIQNNSGNDAHGMFFVAD